MDNRPDQASRLRRQTEEIAAEESARQQEKLDDLSPEAARRTLQELRIRQVELELENEELRRARDEREISRQRYFHLYDLAPSGCLTIDEHGLIREANLTAATLMGDPRGVLHAQPFSRYVHTQDQNTYHLHRTLLVENGQQQRYDLRMVKRNGTEFWAQVTVILERDGDDEAHSSHITVTDITEYKQSEDALRRANERLDLAKSAADAGIWDWDIVSGRIEWSPEMFRLFGIDPGKDTAGFDSWRAALHPDDREAATERIESAVREGSILDSEYRVLLPDGSVRWINARGRSLCDRQGQPVRMLGICMDVTRRRLTEEALRHSEDRYRSLVELSPDAVFVNRNNRIVFVNQAAVRLFGASSTVELVGKDPFDLRLPEYHAIFRARNERCLNGEAMPLIEGKILRLDGSIVDVEESAARFETGEGAAIQVILRDITARKEAETALQQSLTEKEVLLREVHHRVKNNLASIVGLLELQKEVITDEAALDLLKEISDRVLSMSLIHERLYRSKNMARIEFQPYLSELASQLLASYGADSYIRCRVEATGVEAELDTAIPIGLIVNELVTNAIKYAFPMGVPRQGSDGCEIVISALTEDDACTLAVSDNGVGMPPDLDWRSCPSLGLRLVSMLGEHQLGGQLRLDQAGGTCFVLTFSERRRDGRGR
jgi:PAS domain S-box-containing protein